MANRRVGGRIYVRINGRVIQAGGEFTINYGTPVRETVVGPDGVHGFTEQPGEPMISGTVVDEPGLDIQAMLSATGVQVTVELPNGDTASMRDAWQAGTGEYKSNAGTFDVKYCGTSIQRLAA